MNKQQKINTCLKLVSPAYRLDKNSIRVNAHNKVSHEMAKFLLAFQYIKEGYEVYTEVIFKNKSRADILIPELFRVIEVLDSETVEQFKAKTESYPSELEIFWEKAEDIISPYYKLY